jgi:hypothetical protein
VLVQGMGLNDSIHSPLLARNPRITCSLDYSEYQQKGRSVLPQTAQWQYY